jgi:hypothetical protein
LPVFFPPEGCLGHAPVHAQPLPVDALETVVFQQARPPHLDEDALADPLLKAVVGRGAGTELGGVQRFPLTAGAQDEKNGVQTDAVGSARPAAAKPMRVHMFWQEPFNFSPEVIGDAPLIRYGCIAHKQLLKRTQLSRKTPQLHEGVIGPKGLFG